MLDLQKYTKLCQMKDELDYYELLRDNNSFKFNKSKYLKLKEKYKDLYFNQLDIPKNDMSVNLKDYLKACIEILNYNKKANEPKWQYVYTQLDHRHYESEHFYGYHAYDDYVYQVSLVCGKKEMPVCVVNRELSYTKNEFIKLLSDNIQAPFCLRLDKVDPSLSLQVNKALKMAGVLVWLNAQKKDIEKELSLIQKRIAFYQQERKDKEKQCSDLERQIETLQIKDLTAFKNR